jgi:Sigma-70, region 4
VTFGHALPGLHLIAGQPLDPAELPGRVRGALSREGIREWGGLAGYGVQDLLAIRMLGTGSVRLIAEAAVWRVAVIALGERTGSPVAPDAAAPGRAMLPAGCVAIPVQALAAWAVVERGITTVGGLLALAPDLTGLPPEIASEWELARDTDLRRLAGGPPTMPQLPGLLRDLLAEVDGRRREILTRRTFAPQPQTLDTLAAAFGISRGRVRQLEESARVQIATAARGPRYAPLRWRAHTVATDPDPDLLHTAGPWAGHLLRWLVRQTQPPPGHKT